jgi:predicted RNase H-like nuclease (RuvC/YqgF family)
MDDNFTTGSDGRFDEIMAALQDLLKDQRETTTMLKEMNRNVQRELDRPPPVPADNQALLNLRRDYVNLWEMYANTQQRIDRLERRVAELERKLEPPLPPFPGLGPKP